MLVSVGGVCDATLNMRHMQVESLFLELCEMSIHSSFGLLLTHLPYPSTHDLTSYSLSLELFVTV